VDRVGIVDWGMVDWGIGDRVIVGFSTSKETQGVKMGW
jgi:hypothetical protein